jgi:hypothetical protein
MRPAFYRETEIFMECGSLAAAFLRNGWNVTTPNHGQASPFFEN